MEKYLSETGVYPVSEARPAKVPCRHAGGVRAPDLIGEDCRMGELILVRHGETQWSRDHRHTGRPDIPLTPAGEKAAATLAPELATRTIVAAFTSPAQRAVRTAALTGLTGAKPDPDLQEWDYGGYEGRTTDEIRTQRPGWYLWRDGVIPGDASHPGETVSQVGDRADAVLSRARRLLADGDVALVAHAHLLRVLAARWLGLPPADGRLFQLDTGTLSTLGTEHDVPVISTWNRPPSCQQGPRMAVGRRPAAGGRS